MPEETNVASKAKCVEEATAYKEEIELKLKNGDVDGATAAAKSAAQSIMGAESKEIFLSFSKLFMKMADAEKERRKKTKNIADSDITLHASGEFNDRIFSLYASAAYMARMGGDRRELSNIHYCYRSALGEYADNWDSVFNKILRDVS